MQSEGGILIILQYFKNIEIYCIRITSYETSAKLYIYETCSSITREERCNLSAKTFPALIQTPGTTNHLPYTNYKRTPLTSRLYV